MALLIMDLIISILQAVCFSYIINFCLKQEIKNYKTKLIELILIFGFVNSIFTNLLGNLSICVFLIHTISLLILIAIYKDNRLGAIVSYTIPYSLMAICSAFFGNLFLGYIIKIINVEYINLARLGILYMPPVILVYLCIKNIGKIARLYKFLMSEKQYIVVLIISSFILDFIISFYLMIYNQENKLLKNIIIIILSLYLIIITIYFMRIQQRSEQIFELNEALTIKNDELRKIKHDYGAQISYLYGLCLMNRVDDLKKALKRIIDSNQSTPTAVEINESNNSLIALALQPAVDMGIHVMIKGDGDINLSEMPEMELYRVISNIVNNAIKAMNGEGTIIVKIFEHIESLIIKIENNGPKIDEEHMEKIFEAGFTTKNNIDKNHGFGLSIVKSLIENYDGKISVKSTDESTEFKIVLPIK